MRYVLVEKEEKEQTKSGSASMVPQLIRFRMCAFKKLTLTQFHTVGKNAGAFTTTVSCNVSGKLAVASCDATCKCVRSCQINLSDARSKSTIVVTDDIGTSCGW
jgi:hypothetical protein